MSLPLYYKYKYTRDGWYNNYSSLYLTLEQLRGMYAALNYRGSIGAPKVDDIHRGDVPAVQFQELPQNADQNTAVPYPYSFFRFPSELHAVNTTMVVRGNGGLVTIEPNDLQQFLEGFALFTHDMNEFELCDVYGECKDIDLQNYDRSETPTGKRQRKNYILEKYASGKVLSPNEQLTINTILFNSPTETVISRNIIAVLPVQEFDRYVRRILASSDRKDALNTVAKYIIYNPVFLEYVMEDKRLVEAGLTRDAIMYEAMKRDNSHRISNEWISPDEVVQRREISLQYLQQ